MIADYDINLSDSFDLRQHISTKRHCSLKKRRLATSIRLVSDRSVQPAYPLPPMSIPPSPSPLSSAPASSASTAAIPSAVTSAIGEAVATFVASPATIAPGVVNPASAAPPFQPTAGPSTYISFAIPSTAPAFTYQPTGLASGNQHPILAPGQASRGSRRSKTHVVSACVNCKRAHLSCDVQRPCARCVASGKQDTCVDVQHKKRGRPRVHGETGLRRRGDEPGSSSAQMGGFAGPSQTTPRLVASTRHRRADSFRSLRSQASDETSSYEMVTPRSVGQPPLRSPTSAQGSAETSISRLQQEVPTALLNTDLVVLRANRSFEHIMLAGGDVRGRHISDLAAPADNESFLSLQHNLRAERESREPAYMAPIMQPGQDPVLGIPEIRVDQYTQGFNDRTHTWTGIQRNARTETFPARVRLAKAATYFVVVTLPNFRPVEPPAYIPYAPVYGSPFVGGPLTQTPRYSAIRHTQAHSAPPLTRFAIPGTTAAVQAGERGIHPDVSQTYPPSQPAIPYQQQQQPFFPFGAAVPRIPTAEPLFEATVATPLSAPVEPPQPGAPAQVQLPPPIARDPSNLQGLQTADRPGSDEEDESRRSPRKRRRMGIDDVLQ